MWQPSEAHELVGPLRAWTWGRTNASHRQAKGLARPIKNRGAESKEHSEGRCKEERRHCLFSRREPERKEKERPVLGYWVGPWLFLPKEAFRSSRQGNLPEELVLRSFLQASRQPIGPNSLLTVVLFKLRCWKDESVRIFSKGDQQAVCSASPAWLSVPTARPRLCRGGGTVLGRCDASTPLETASS